MIEMESEMSRRQAYLAQSDKSFNVHALSVPSAAAQKHGLSIELIEPHMLGDLNIPIDTVSVIAVLR